MHHRLIADLGLEILGLEILSLEILSLKILNKIFALIRIAHLDYTLSAGKKIISQLVLCWGASMAGETVSSRPSASRVSPLRLRPPCAKGAFVDEN